MREDEGVSGIARLAKVLGVTKQELREAFILIALWLIFSGLGLYFLPSIFNALDRWFGV